MSIDARRLEQNEARGTTASATIDLGQIVIEPRGMAKAAIDLGPKTGHTIIIPLVRLIEPVTPSGPLTEISRLGGLRIFTENLSPEPVALDLDITAYEATDSLARVWRGMKELLDGIFEDPDASALFQRRAFPMILEPHRLTHIPLPAGIILTVESSEPLAILLEVNIGESDRAPGSTESGHST